MKKIILLVCFSAIVCGCSKRAWYDGFQSGLRYECGKYEGPSRDKCLKNADKSYEEYTKDINSGKSMKERVVDR